MIRALFKKELLTRFNSPMIYILTAIFSLLAGWIFFNLLMNYSQIVQNPQTRAQVNFGQYVVLGFFGNLNFIMAILIPILSMDVFSKEYESNTFYLLIKSKLTPMKIILVKYICLLLTSLFLISGISVIGIVFWVSGLKDLSLLLTGFLGLFFNISVYAAIGMFASFLCKKSVLASFFACVMIFMFWLLPWSKAYVQSYFWLELIELLSINYHFEKIGQGLLSTESLMFYLSSNVFFIYLSHQWMKLRRFV